MLVVDPTRQRVGIFFFRNFLMIFWEECQLDANCFYIYCDIFGSIFLNGCLREGVWPRVVVGSKNGWFRSILHERNAQPSVIAHHVGSWNSLHHWWFFLENLSAHPKHTGMMIWVLQQSLISFGSFGRRITFSQIRKHSWFQKAELRWDFNFAFRSYSVILDFLVKSESGDFWRSWLA